MIVNTYGVHNFKAYKKIFSCWLEQLDIYYDYDYLVCESKLNNSELEIFTILKGDDVFIYPYFKLKFKQNSYFDIISPYGYAGPFCTNIEFLRVSENLFLNYIRDSGCITEFIRYHYKTEKNLFFSSHVDNIFNRQIVLIDLKKGFDKIWAEDFTTTNRNVIRKVEKEGYLLHISNTEEDIEEFIDMYDLTMKNVAAENYYFFEKQYFFNLFRRINNKIVLAKVVKDNITYSSALFLKSGDILTYYLSARNLNFTNVPSSNFLLSEIVKYGINNNLSILNLGGGRSVHDQDALLKFKCNFNKNTTPFYIGKRIHSQEQYEMLISKYIQENDLVEFNKRKHILQFYR